MSHSQRDDAIARALDEVLASLRGLVSRAHRIRELGEQNGRPMDRSVARARDLARQLESVARSAGSSDGGEEAFHHRGDALHLPAKRGDYHISRSEDGRGERILVRCVTNMLDVEEDELDPETEALEPTQPERVDLQGNLNALGVPELFSFLESLGKTGVLTLKSVDETFTIVLDEGAVVHAISDHSPVGERLGDFLVAQGATTTEELASFLRRFTHTHSIGDSVIADGLVTKEELAEALRGQVQALFHRMFATTDAAFEYTDGETDPPPVGVRMNVTRLLLESVVETDHRCAG